MYPETQRPPSIGGSRAPTVYSASGNGSRPAQRRSNAAAVLLAGILTAITLTIVLLICPVEYELVLAPVLVAAAVVGLLIVRLADSSNGAPLSELGAYYGIALCLYCAMPILAYILRGLTFDRYSDNRLFFLQPTAGDMATHAWRYTLYTGAFVVSYIWARKGTAGAIRPLTMPDPSVVRTTLIVLAVIEVFLFTYRLLYGAGGETYGEQAFNRANAAAQVPLLVRQTEAQLSGSVHILKLLIMTVLMKRYARWRFVLQSWLLVEFGLLLVGLGARTPFVYLCIAFAFLYDRFVRRVRLRNALILGTVGIAAFVLIGFVRTYGALPSAGGPSPLTATAEFDSLFGTSYDLFRRRDLDLLPPRPVQLYCSDIVNLIPSQLLPFQKWDGAEWYLNLIGVSGKGVGLAFGAISEAAIGLGWIEIGIRGILIGLVFGWLQRWYIRRSSSVWVTILYAFIIMTSYQSFRASSFYIILLLWFNVLPALLFIRLASSGGGDARMRLRAAR